MGREHWVSGRIFLHSMVAAMMPIDSLMFARRRYCWYESFERRRQGPATHRVRVFPESNDDAAQVSSIKPTAGHLHKIHLVGPDAPAWSIEPPDLGGNRACRRHSGRLDGCIPHGRKWHSHQTVMGLKYTRYEFTRFQSRQEQVGKRDIVTEPRLWMDSTAQFDVEDLPPVAAGGEHTSGAE